MSARRLKQYLAILIFLVVALGVAIVPFESEHLIKNFGDGLWWAVTTITTVGYGDLVPVTPVGRAMGILLMLGGISIFWLVIALITANFTKKEKEYLTKRLKIDLESVNNKLYRLEQKLDYLIKQKK